MPPVQIILAVLGVAAPLLSAGAAVGDVLVSVVNTLLRVTSDDQKLALERALVHVLRTWLRTWPGPDSGVFSTDDVRRRAALRTALINDAEDPPRCGPYKPL